tara:strand:+ start:586 stop:1656 length:1071 start_codon:yes stop_codon:yes gene_type:complete
MATSAWAYNETDLLKLKALNSCKGCDLSGADLSGADLSGADLSGADLSRANLAGANLINTKLLGANLKKTDLTKANLTEAQLQEADLSGAKLTGVSLRNADLQRVKYCKTQMPWGEVNDNCQEGSEGKEFYQIFTEVYCEETPYSCKFDGSIVSYKVDEFLRRLYIEVDKAFANNGFTDVQFEYCRDGARCHRVVDNEEMELKVKWTHDNYVKEGPYRITKQYPPNKRWYAANGGVNRDLGIHFYKSLTPSEYDRYCTSKYKTGKTLKRNIEINEDMLFSDIYEFYKKDYKVLYRLLLPNLVGFEPVAIPKMDTSCLIVDNDLFIPTQLVSREKWFSIRKKTVVLYGKALNNLTRE